MASLLLKVILATSLLAHSVLGCCWHHAHGQECAATSAEPAEHCHAEHADDGCGAHSHGALSLAVGDAHTHAPDCDEPDCSFVKGGVTPPLLAQTPALVLLLSPADIAGSTQRLLDRAADQGAAPVPAAALRALLQVWLT